jgi:hypothetical protein
MKEYRDQIKKEIKAKFGTVPRFCAIANLPYWGMAKILRESESESELNSIRDKIALFENRSIQGQEITPELIKKIKIALIGYKDGRSRTFCKDHGIHEVDFSMIITGKRRFITKLVIEICQKLNVEWL